MSPPRPPSPSTIQTRPATATTSLAVITLAQIRSAQRALPAWQVVTRPSRPRIFYKTKLDRSKSTAFKMPPSKAEQKADKSYLSSAVQSLNPWGSRSATPTPSDHAEPASPAPAAAPSSDPRDHTIPQLYGQSLRNYPSDCPPLQVQWFHAVDVSLLNPNDSLFATAET